MDVRFGDWIVSYSSRGNPTYSVEMWHDGLNKHRVVRGSDEDVVRRKVDLQAEQWDSAWRRAQEKEASRRTKEDARAYAERRKDEADSLTEEAEAEQRLLQDILAATLRVDDAIDWKALLDSSSFPEPEPGFVAPYEPAMPRMPSEPRRTDERYRPRINILHHLIPPLKRRRLEEAESEFLRAHAIWLKAKDYAARAHTTAMEQYQVALSTARANHEHQIAEWAKRRELFQAKQHARNEAVARKKSEWLAGNEDAVQEYGDMVLSNSKYPDYFPKEFELEYVQATRCLIVEYLLPDISDLPRLASVKYVASRDEMVEKTISESQLQKLYDEVIYQIALRTLHELFESDAAQAIDAVVFNGWVASIDKRSGQQIKPCIMSVRATKAEFSSLELSRVEPKACFKALKGIGSSKLHSLTPIAPVQTLSREDQRFVVNKDVAHSLSEGSNLAAMDWEDFEHLIREVFAKEFSTGGGEVKVTRASRDGGVDAVAFDPDPIRGGKIVIQAKRYTNTVGVSAVRDLYGTLLNEGATKGVLVTTSDYGPDAYEFATGKPITLLNGANLLHLLEKHGHKARIDLQEAKLLGANPST